MSGWIKLHRKILQWEWYSCHNTTRVFIHLLLTANWKDSTWQGIEIPRGSVFASPDTLAAATGLSRQKVRTVLERLKASSQITTKATSRGTLITLSNFETYNCEVCESSQQPIQKGRDALTTSKEVEEVQDVKKKETPKSPKGDDGFNEFWKVYPKKVGRAKAIKVWQKLKPNLDEVKAALAWQTALPQWNKDDRQYVPHPTTYLNERRWEDVRPGTVQTQIVAVPNPDGPPKDYLEILNDESIIPYEVKFNHGGNFARWRDLPEDARQKIRIESARRAEVAANGPRIAADAPEANSEGDHSREDATAPLRAFMDQMAG